MKKPLHKRKKKWPTAEEFWESNVPVNFRLIADEQAEWRKFRTWLRRYFRQIEQQPDYDYDTAATEAFRDKIDFCIGDFDEKGVVNTDMAIFKFDQSIFMTKEEIEATPDEQRPKRFEPVTMLDLQKDEKYMTKKEDLKVQEIQAE